MNNYICERDIQATSLRDPPGFRLAEFPRTIANGADNGARRYGE